MRVRYKIFLAIDGLLLLFCVGVFFSYRHFLNQEKENSKSSEAVVLTTGTLSVNYLDGQYISIPKVNIGEVKKYRFSVTNTGDEVSYYTLNFLNTNNPYSSKLIFHLSSTNEGTSLNNKMYPTEDFILSDYIQIKPGVTQSYTMVIVYNGTQEEIVEEEINGTVLVGTEKPLESGFKTMILNNNPIKKAETIPGKASSTTDEGLISGEDDDGTTYYFRGAVKNNYVEFADLTWRIVRVNGDGSVRLILDDILDGSNKVYNTNNVSSVVEERTSHAKYEESAIKTFLDTWYEENLKEKDNYIMTTRFCNDMGSDASSTNLNYLFNPYVRLFQTNQPSYFCKEYSSSLKIGLLNADEAVFAGAYEGNANTSYYLYNSSIYSSWWTSSPGKSNLSYAPSMIVIKSNGSLINSSTVNLQSIRPVINLNKNVKMVGSGTVNDPYKLEE